MVNTISTVKFNNDKVLFLYNLQYNFGLRIVVNPIHRYIINPIIDIPSEIIQ